MDPSLVVAEKETYFFQQTSSRHAPKRYRKQPEELPHDLRFAHLNPRVAAYLASKEKEQKLPNEFDDGLGNKSLLPQINHTVSLIRHRLDSFLSSESDAQRVLFEETKARSPSILDQLARLLSLFEGLKVHLPASLEQQLLQSWKDLITEAKYANRDWQIPANKEAYEKPQRSDQSSKCEDGKDSEAEEDTRTSDGRRNRSKMTIKTNASHSREGSVEGRAETVVRLVEPGTPNPGTAKGKASMLTKSRMTSSKSRADSRDIRPPSAAGSRSSLIRARTGLRPEDTMSVLAESMSDGTRSAVAQPSFVQTIQFQLSSKACDERGWIIHPGSSDEKEWKSALEWAVQRLQACKRHRIEEKTLEEEYCLDQQPSLKFYGDGQKEQIQKYKGRGRERVNTGLYKGQKPKIPTLPDGDGRPLLMASAGDGSSSVFYPNGRMAIVSSRSGVGKPGYYTFVYDDSPEQKLIAMFTPSGRNCCYHDNGVVHFLTSETGGTMAENNGAISKRWTWPSHGSKLPVTITFHINNNILFKCSSLSQMQLCFNCQKEQVKMNVGMVTGAEELPSREELGHLLTGIMFSSHASKEFSKPYKPKTSTSRSKGKGKGKLSTGANRGSHQGSANSKSSRGGNTDSNGHSSHSTAKIDFSQSSIDIYHNTHNNQAHILWGDSHTVSDLGNQHNQGDIPPAGSSKMPDENDIKKQCHVIQSRSSAATTAQNTPVTNATQKDASNRQASSRPILKNDSADVINSVQNAESSETKEGNRRNTRNQHKTHLKLITKPTLHSPDKSKSPIPASELQKLLADLPMEKTENDVNADKELIKLNRKIRILTEDWLEHYRIAVGMMAPQLKSVSDSPFSKTLRNINSAKSSPAGGGIVIIESPATQVERATLTCRAPSAPVARKERAHSATSETVSEQQPTVKFVEDPPEEIELSDQLSVERMTPFLSTATSLTGSQSKRTRSAPLHRSVTNLESISLTVGLCTVALRHSLLGEEGTICKCSRHHIPYITDIEYDIFIKEHLPPEQLLIISVVSSIFPESNRGQEVLQKMYSERNKNRTRPCIQSRSDAFRILLYDVATAADNSNYSHPLLLRRHNVIAGMFLMYQDSKLLFCDHIFNGYGNERKDLQKQMIETRKMAALGHSLPNDFQFSPQHGREGLRSAWGGEIGGAGVDHHGSAGLSLANSVIKKSSISSTDSSLSNEPQYMIQISGLNTSIEVVRNGLNVVAIDMLPTFKRSSKPSILKPTTSTSLPKIRITRAKRSVIRAQ